MVLVWYGVGMLVWCGVSIVLVWRGIGMGFTWRRYDSGIIRYWNGIGMQRGGIGIV